MLKKTVAIFLALILICSSFSIGAFAKTTEKEYEIENGFYYQIINGEAVILGSSNASGELIIPETLGGKPVGKIESSAYYCNYDITSLYVPDTCHDIAGDAFLNCTKLKEIRLPEYIELSWQVFLNTAFSNNSENWENGVLYLGTHLLHVKKATEGKVTVKPGTVTVADCAFEQCGKITEVEFPETLRYLGGFQFLNCYALEKVNIPEQVTKLYGDTFTKCAFDSVEIHKNITYIASTAFDRCQNVKTITVDSENKFYEGVNNCIIEKETKTLVMGCINSVIPEGVKKIGDHAFYASQSPVEVVLPDSVIAVGTYAFYDSETLEKITLSKNLETIENHAFAVSKKLESVALPKTIKKIDSDAFWKCESLKKVEFSRESEGIFIGNYAFSECAIEDVFIPKNCEMSNAFGDCANLKKVEFFGEDTTIEWNLNNCPIEEVVIAEGSKKLEWTAIPYPENIKSVTLPSSLEVVGAFAFENCAQLEEIVLPASLKEIGVSPFNNCPKLEKIELLSDSVDVAYSDSLDGTAYIENEDNWENGVLYFGNILIKAKEDISGVLNIKSGTRILAYSALLEKTGLTGVTFPESVIKLSDQALRGCSGLIEVDIPSTIKEIGECVFNETENTRYTCYAHSAGFDYFMNMYNIHNDKITYVCDHEEVEHLCYEAPTCSMEGNTGFKRCKICFKDITEAKNTPATGKHIKVLTKSKKATPSRDGYITYACKTCRWYSQTTDIYKPQRIKLGKTKYEYTGKQPKISLKVYNSRGSVISSSNYQVSVASNSVGKQKVTISFKGSKYSGKMYCYIEITPKKPTIKTLSAKKKGFKISWNKQASASGYEIQYSKSSSFKSADKLTIKSNKTTSKTLLNLLAKKKYYVRIRSYKTVGKKKYYSSYSSAKKVTTK